MFIYIYTPSCGINDVNAVSMCVRVCVWLMMAAAGCARWEGTCERQDNRDHWLRTSKPDLAVFLSIAGSHRRHCSTA